jgi:hypothetical protein
MDIASARAIRAKAAQQWDQQLSEAPTFRPTPTRAENQAKAETGDIVLVKEWDQSPIDAHAIDPLFDPGDLPPPPPAIPMIFCSAQVGATLCALPGLVTPRRIFQWTRDGVAIPNAVVLRYTLTAADVGHRISFSVTRARQVARARELGPVVRPGR